MDTSSSRSRKRTRANDHDEASWVQAFKRPRIEESPVKLQNESYTIAWICALPIEMAAANAMLDGVHPSLPSNAKDSNSYILGNVGRHNIVVACLPADHYGTNSAAVVANNLIRTFPYIRIGLMVGIGGGVPGSVDVRLGDVVVGYNVVQHDLDSHKNKQWQEYAAATAATYAKELLIEAVPEAVIESRLKPSDSCSAEPETALAPWQASTSQWTTPQLQQSIPILFQQQLCQQLPLSPVLVIDSRGYYLPFYLETIDSKELFVEILRHRFKNLGTNKIERGEWTLEYQHNGQCLDLSSDWQSVIKPNQILNMRMIFRRQNNSSTKCPSCGFMNPGLQSDQVQCRRCSLNFRRVEEIQDIRISSDSSNAQTDLVEISAARFQRPRPPKPQNPEDDICRYKQIQLVDVDFKIGLPTVDQLAMKTALKLNSGDLSDIEHLAERLSLVYGLSEADSIALSQMIDVQHAHICSLQRHPINSDTDSDIVSDLASKSRQFWPKTRVQRSRSLDHPKPGSESDALDLNTIRAPGGFRREHLRRDIISPSRNQKNGYKGADSTGTNQAPLTSNFVEFLSMYGQFAGEDLEEDDEGLSPNEYTQSNIKTLPGVIEDYYEQKLGSSNHHSSTQEVLSSVNAYKRPPILSELKGALSMGDTVHSQEPNISLDMAMPEMPTWQDPPSPVMKAVHPKLVYSPPPDIPITQIRPVSGPAVLVTYLGGGSQPEKT
ncbi:hypothetical protein TsFJ059_000220 [Trichoderma semiorbis]|uniref:Nucleoside phosphorylase domain-containing protein n=1 Tax=Trichoderma semiorbis TaxID=1491008 RepID=A0A9P8KWW1_9HYPO|nr:hypothetical protein TsFJ059_000220 [Trichoderma semiorbis]